jgi:hypothetical protein
VEFEHAFVGAVAKSDAHNKSKHGMTSAMQDPKRLTSSDNLQQNVKDLTFFAGCFFDRLRQKVSFSLPAKSCLSNLCVSSHASSFDRFHANSDVAQVASVVHCQNLMCNHHPKLFEHWCWPFLQE